ncbi:MAG: SDR family NAD(P)-dependent oxidoreductase [Elusimicrobiota bacterium]
MQLKKSRTLVTGAGGFIGSHLVEELIKKSTKVKALVRYNSRNDWGMIEELPEEIKSNIEVVTGDIRDPHFCLKITKDTDIIFHLAAVISIPFSYTAPSHYAETNIIGTLNILEAALKNNLQKVIHTSTSEVYGTAQYTPINERHPLVGQSPYSASKIAADKLAESYFCSFKLPVATIRPFNTFGPRQSARAIIPTIISQLILNKKNIKIGSLSPIRDFTYVKDTVKSFIKAAESEKTIGSVINIGSGKGINIGDLYNLLCKLMDRSAKSSRDIKRVRPDGSEVMVLICDNTKAKKVLNWKPECNLEEGLLETIAYIEKNIERYKTGVYNI